MNALDTSMSSKGQLHVEAGFRMEVLSSSWFYHGKLCMITIIIIIWRALILSSGE